MSTLITNNSGVVRDMEEIVPLVGTSGFFVVAAPYTGLVREHVEYTVTAVASIAASIAAGEDPLQDVYLANSDTEENFEEARDAGHHLITIQAGVGDVVVIPAKALQLVPQADGIRYTSVVLGIALSVLPDDMDLTALETEISDLVMSVIGVRSSVYQTTVGSTMIVPHAQHAAIEAARLDNIESSLTVRTKYANLQAAFATLQAQNAALEDYVKENLPPAP